MGTNFYLVQHLYLNGKYVVDEPCECCGRSNFPDDHMSPVVHIGKRSAAGLYCWDCNVTFCVDGPERIHFEGAQWVDACPKCGAKQGSPENLNDSAGGVELGFAKPKSVRPTGVRSCASFSWAQPPDEFRAFAVQYPKTEIVKDEYGRRLKGGEFLDMLTSNCPIELVYFVGDSFA